MESSPNTPLLLHYQLFIELGRHHIFPESREYKDFKTLCRAYLCRSAIERCKDVTDLLDALETQNIINVGKYDTLKTMLEIVCKSSLKTLATFEGRIAATETPRLVPVEQAAGYQRGYDTSTSATFGASRKRGISTTTVTESSNADSDKSLLGQEPGLTDKVPAGKRPKMKMVIIVLGDESTDDLLDNPAFRTRIKEEMARQTDCSDSSLSAGSIVINLDLSSLQGFLSIWLKYLDMTLVNKIASIVREFRPGARVFVRLEMTGEDFRISLSELGDTFLEETVFTRSKGQALIQTLETISEMIAYGNFESSLRECILQLIARIDSHCQSSIRDSDVKADDRQGADGGQLGMQNKDTLPTSSTTQIDDLTHIIEDILEILKTKDMEPEIIDELNQHFPILLGEYRNILDMWDRKLARLKEGTCISVIGTSGSGKSTVVNLLIGEDILPTSIFSAQRTIYKVTSCPEKSYSCKWDGTKADVHRTLDETSSAQTVRDYIRIVTCDEFHLQWPIDDYKDKSLTLVDIPDVAESHEINVRISSILHKATAVLVVVDSATPGDISQYERISQRLFPKGRGLKESCTDFIDPSSVLFICTKWDQVPEIDKHVVREDIERRIANFFPSFDPSQLLTLSRPDPFAQQFRPAKEKFGEQTKKTEPDRRRALTDVVKNLIRKRTTIEIVNLDRNIIYFLESFQKSLASRIRYVQEPPDLARRRLEMVRRDLKLLEQNISAILEKLLKSKHKPLVASVRLALSNERWPTDAGGAETDLKNFAYEYLSQVITKALESSINVEEELTQLSKEIDQLMLTKMPEINELIGAGGSDRQRIFCENTARFLENRYIFRVTLILTLMGFLMAPFATLTKLARELVSWMKGLLGIKKTLAEYFKDALECCDEGAIKQIVDEYLARYQQIIDIFRAESVDSHISTSLHLVEHLEALKPVESKAVIQSHYEYLRKCRALIGKAQLVDIRQRNLKYDFLEGRSNWFHLGTGSFFVTYCGKITDADSPSPQEIAIKEMTISPDPTIFGKQMTELYNISVLRHPNLVRYHGGQHEKAPMEVNPRLLLITEFCDGSLDRTFTERSRFPGDHSLGTERRTAAFQMYQRCSRQICEGVNYLHDRLYVHKDLKLENMRVAENGDIKIADYGETVRRDATNRLIGTPLYEAPEVILEENFTTASDIYALGVILWELWYGRRAFDSDPTWNPLNVVNGLRLDFATDHKPGGKLQELLTRCWVHDPDNRADAVEVLRVVTSLN